MLHELIVVRVPKGQTISFFPEIIFHFQPTFFIHFHDFNWESSSDVLIFSINKDSAAKTFIPSLKDGKHHVNFSQIYFQ